MKKLIIVLFISLCFTGLINISGIVAYADDWAQETFYEIEFEGENKVFYMYPYEDDNDDYLKSGLYYKTDPLENIYYINSAGTSNPRYFYHGSLVFSKDGMSFVHLPWTATYGERGGPALEFYSNGSLVKEYYVSDLVKDKRKLEYSVSHVQWEKAGTREFDELNNVLSVTTKDDRTIKFDISTGEMIAKPIDYGGKLIFVISAVIGLSVLAAVIIIYKNRKRK